MANGEGFSFPYGVPLVGYPLLAWGIAAGAGHWWGVLLTLAALLLAGVFAWEGLSNKEYEAIHARDPTLNRLTWQVNWLLFFALPPLVLGLFGVAAIFAAPR